MMCSYPMWSLGGFGRFIRRFLRLFRVSYCNLATAGGASCSTPLLIGGSAIAFHLAIKAGGTSSGLCCAMICCAPLPPPFHATALFHQHPVPPIRCSITDVHHAQLLPLVQHSQPAPSSPPPDLQQTPTRGAPLVPHAAPNPS